MKKILFTVLSAILAISLAACANTNTPDSSDVNSNAPVETPAPVTTTEPTTTPEPVMEITGTLHVDDILNLDASKYSLLSESVIDEDGPDTVFYSDGIVKNVVIEHGQMDFDGMKFIPDEEPLFETDVFPADSMVTVRIYHPDVAAVLRVSFEDVEGEHSYYVYQSGKDGSLFFSEE